VRALSGGRGHDGVELLFRDADTDPERRQEDERGKRKQIPP